MTDDVYNDLAAAPVRVRRLFAIACYWLVKEYAGSVIFDNAVRMAEAAEKSDWDREILADHNLACRQVQGPHCVQKWDYKAEMAQQLATLCTDEDVNVESLSGIVWVIAGMKPQCEYIEKIDACLDPACEKQLVYDRQSYPHIEQIAQKCVTDRGAIPILADALEEIGLDSSHLRLPGHWYGCWVLDTILRRR